MELAGEPEELPDGEVPAGALIRDFVGFEVKLVLDGLKDFVLAQVAIVAILLELVFIRRQRGRIFYGVMGLGARFEDWLRLYEPVSGDPDADEKIDANRILRHAEQRIFTQRRQEDDEKDRA